MGRLEQKVAIITGGAGGIGKAAGKLFANEGACVLLVDLDEAALEAAVAEISRDTVSYCVADVVRADDNANMVAVAEERYGGVDVLLANAGVEGDFVPILELEEKSFDRVMNINVKGPMLGMQAAVPAMAKRGGGSIVITSSVAGVSGVPMMCAYSTSKHAVIGLMRSAAKEFAAMNVRVNTVNPSPVETRMMRSLESGLAPGDEQALQQEMKARIPLARYGNPDEIARSMLYLASDDSSWVTGSVNVVDGGMTS